MKQLLVSLPLLDKDSKMKRVLLFFLAGFFMMIMYCASAQDMAQHTAYMFNKQLFNPAYVGSKDAASLNLTYRKQWAKIDGSPQTFTAGAHMPLDKNAGISKNSVGLYLQHDKLGITRNFSVALQYAYRIKVGKQSALSFGTEASFVQHRQSDDDIRGSENDIAVNQVNYSQTLPNFGFGIRYQAKQFFAGLSIPRLITNNYRYSDDGNNGTAEQLRHFYLSGGVLVKASDLVKLKPQVLTKYAHGDNVTVPFDLDANVMLLWKDLIGTGVSYRLGESFGGIFQVIIAEKLQFVYAYDVAYNGTQSAHGGSHEVMLEYVFRSGGAHFTSPRMSTYF